MPRTFIACFFLAALFTACTPEVKNETAVMTFNIRYDNPSDGQNAWSHRSSIVAGFINEQAPDLIGLQEVLWHQYEYLDSALAGYSSLAAGRDDGLKKGEACPVFFRSGRFSLIDGGTFWLSSTPEVPGSIGWGAALTRIATWVRLLDTNMNDTLLFVNTHFDHISDSARFMSSGVLLSKVKELSGENDFIITGDFNALPQSLAILRMKEDGLAMDAFTVSEKVPEGESYTFNGWRDAPGEERIDYIFVRKDIKVLSYHTHRIIEQGVFISDHWPVSARLSRQ